MNNIDQVSLELSKEIAENLKKAMPPKLAYRYRRWLQRMRPKSIQESLKLSEKNTMTLEKNDVITSVYDSGHIKLEFGADVSDKVKKAAIEWAKKKGLKASEASLTKSAGGSSWIIFTNDEQSKLGKCLEQSKLSV